MSRPILSRKRKRDSEKTQPIVPAPKFKATMQRILVFSPSGSPPSAPAYRTFLVPKALLLKHTTGFHGILTNQSSEEPIILTNSDPKAFKDFVDFVHSSIYSPWTSAPDFKPASGLSRAYVLGATLGCRAFRDAALYKLHDVIEQLGTYDEICLELSLALVPADLQYAVEHTREDSGLRRVLIDGVLSHATHAERMAIGKLEEKQKVEGELSWLECYLEYPDFRAALLVSLNVCDGNRRGLLKEVEEYFELDRSADRERREEVVEAVGSSQKQRVEEEERDLETDTGSDSGEGACFTPTTEEEASVQGETTNDSQEEEGKSPGSDVE